MSATEAEVPIGSEISRRLGGAYFHDCYAVSLQHGGRSALDLYLGVVVQTPAWVNRLMALRNKAVGLVGLKNLGHLSAVNRSKPSSAYQVGDRVGIFSLLYLTESEVILGDSDKHLNVQLSVCKVTHGEHGSVAVSTVVHIHNMLGRIYMLFVAPVHKLIVPAMLSRARASQNGA
jgi:uncharacterized protein DUF2867